MYVTPEQVVAAGKANLESVLPFATVAFASVERLAAFNLNSARSVLEQNSANVKALFAAKSPEELVAIQSSLVKPALEKALSYSRGLYDIYSDTADEIVKLAEARTVTLNKEFSAAVDKAVESAPAGSEPAVAALKSAMSTANTVYETVSKSVKQVVELAEANAAAAGEAALKAVGTAGAPAKAKKAA